MRRSNPQRRLINLEVRREVHYWSRHFGVTADELIVVAERVGNSAAAIRKELAHQANVKTSSPQV
jgi:Protein of unknown function (DUF3606)